MIVAVAFREEMDDDALPSVFGAGGILMHTDRTMLVPTFLCNNGVLFDRQSPVLRKKNLSFVIIQKHSIFQSKFRFSMRH